jgi:hypothetical protein
MIGNFAEPMTPVKRLLMAKFVMQNHEEDYAPPPYPERPEVLTLDDHELLDAHCLGESGSNLTADKRRALSYFGAWRAAVWASEDDRGMKLLTLVDSAQTFEAQNYEIEADILFGFAEEHYPGFRRSDAPSDLVWCDLREWCRAKMRNYSLLPGYMRTMVQPRGGVPFHRPQGERSEQDVEKPYGQAALPWEEQ